MMSSSVNAKNAFKIWCADVHGENIDTFEAFRRTKTRVYQIFTSPGFHYNVNNNPNKTRTTISALISMAMGKQWYKKRYILWFHYYAIENVKRGRVRGEWEGENNYRMCNVMKCLYCQFALLATEKRKKLFLIMNEHCPSDTRQRLNSFIESFEQRKVRWKEKERMYLITKQREGRKKEKRIL